MNNKQRQWQLYYLGFYGGEIDGIVGPQTIKATRALQTYYGLGVDGIFGSITEAKTIEVIRAIQKELNEQNGARLVVDGLAGNLTKNATKNYQESAGLTVDGIAGVNTRAALLGEITNETPCDWSKIKYFKREEFVCHCDGKYCDGYPAEMKHKLIVVADRVREHFGKPCIVSSGARCKQHNKNVGGVWNSWHLYGKAMDFKVEGVSGAKVLTYVKQQPEITYAYSIDGTYIHMDIG